VEDFYRAVKLEKVYRGLRKITEKKGGRENG